MLIVNVVEFIFFTIFKRNYQVLESIAMNLLKIIIDFKKGQFKFELQIKFKFSNYKFVKLITIF